MMYTFKGDDFSITEAIQEYIEKRFSVFERFGNENISFAISKTTAHDHPDAYLVEVKYGNGFFVSAKDADLMKAIDDAKEELWREVTQNKEKKQTLFLRGARKLKNLIRFRR